MFFRSFRFTALLGGTRKHVVFSNGKECNAPSYKNQDVLSFFQVYCSVEYNTKASQAIKSTCFLALDGMLGCWVQRENLFILLVGLQSMLPRAEITHAAGGFCVLGLHTNHPPSLPLPLKGGHFVWKQLCLVIHLRRSK